ncbi:hypothetical protein PLICRDRAFT_28925, partial [Plicaturopsis crispa FD-325 SS-3]
LVLTVDHNSTVPEFMDSRQLDGHNVDHPSPSAADEQTVDYSVAPHTGEEGLGDTFPTVNSMFTSTPVVLPASGKRKRLVSRVKPRTPSATTPTPTPRAHRDSPNPSLVRRKNDAATPFQLFNSESPEPVQSCGAEKENVSPVVSSDTLQEDLDNEPDRPLEKKKKVADRSARGIEGDRKIVLERSFDYLKIAICTETPFPDIDGGELDEMVLTAWDTACDELGFDEPPTTTEMKLIRMRASQVRGALKGLAVGLVEPAYGFSPIGDSDFDSEGTVNGQDAAIAQNRELVKKLKSKAAFSRLDPHDETLKNSLYRNRIIQKLLNQQWFRNAQADGLRFPEHYSPSGRIPLVTIALIMTACYAFRLNAQSMVGPPVAASLTRT